MTSHSSDAWLAAVYQAKSRDDLVSLYDSWAETYDADIQGIGYLHPAVMAGLVGRHVPIKSEPIFDAGVGTGTVGNILAIMGFTNLIGVDMSDGMLARARPQNLPGSS
jgi:predicted TPR repeat methyltransferase